MEGFHRIAAACPKVAIADPKVNAERIGDLYDQAASCGSAIMVTPELSLTGYTCGDLFFRNDLHEACNVALENLRLRTNGYGTILVVGVPRLIGNRLFNCAVVLQNGKILGTVAKSNLPNYAEYYEKRWFSAGENNTIFTTADGRFSFGVEICEDLWVPSPVSSALATAGAKLIVNLSASTEFLGKSTKRRNRVLAQSAAIEGGYALAAAGPGESTADAIYGGQTLIAVSGQLQCESELFPDEATISYATVDFNAITHRRLRFSGIGNCAQPEVTKVILDAVPDCDAENISKDPFGDEFGENGWAEKILALQSVGLGERLKRTGLKKAVIGVSGGADSALALLGTHRAMQRIGLPAKNIIAIVMPGFGSTEATQTSAAALSHALGCDTRIIDIRAACERHFSDIGHSDSDYDLTFENVQARERTQILMDVANAESGLVIGTGDLSEIALGWSTYNGDHMSMYAINASVPKTMVYAALKELAHLYPSEAATELIRISETPASPELVPGAPVDGTESRIGPYVVHDFLLYHTLVNGDSEIALRKLATAAFRGSYTEEIIDRTVSTFIRRFRVQQFKRNCVPDGPKITLSLSPRADWRMPSDI